MRLRTVCVLLGWVRVNRNLMLMGFALLILAPAASGDVNQITAEERAAGWTLLFDGVSTRGWVEVTGAPLPAASWTVEDGCLKALPNPDGKQDIRTVESYRSFELQFEWKLLKDGNSGVKYLVQRTDRWQKKGRKGYEARARGLEYQLVDDASADAKDPTRITASLYSALAPKGAAPRPLGEFNESRIVVRGEHVEHWLNGVKALEFELSQPEATQVLRNCQGTAGPFLRESPISLQNHTSPVWFRNLKIRRLSSVSLSLGPPFGEEIKSPAIAEKGPELAAAVHGISDRKRPLVLGNGDLGVVWAGGPGKFNLGLGKNDFWGVVRGSICTVGNQSITCPDLRFASFQMEENVGPATITGRFEEKKNERGLSIESWVAYPENVVVTRLENIGAKPLAFQAEIADGYGGGLPTLVGNSNDATWLQVSPDTVPFEVGNRICKVPGPKRTTIKTTKPFVGRIAGLTLSARGSDRPYLPWEPEAPFVQNIGQLKFHPQDSHGTAVEFPGEADHRLILSSGCVPQKGFTLSAWVNATTKLDDGTIFSAISIGESEIVSLPQGVALACCRWKAGGAAELHHACRSAAAAIEPLGRGQGRLRHREPDALC